MRLPILCLFSLFAAFPVLTRSCSAETINYSTYRHWRGSVAVGEDISDFSLHGNYIFVAAKDDGLVIIDRSDESQLQVVMTLDLQGTALGIEVRDQYVYVAVYGVGLMIFGINDPTAPVLVGEVPLQYAKDLAVGAELIYICAYRNGVHVVSNVPEAPVLLHTLDSTNAQSIALTDDYGYFADFNSGMHMMRATAMYPPTRRHITRTTNAAIDITAHGDHAYVAMYDEGVDIIDIADPNDWQRIVGHLDIGTTYCINAANGALLASGSDALRAFDLTDPAAPALIGQHPFRVPGHIDGEGQSIYCAGRFGDISILDVATWEPAPSPGRVDHQGNPEALVLENHHVYAVGETGLTIYDATDPANALQVGHFESNACTDVEIAAPIAICASPEAGLLVLDISTPAQPVLLGANDTINGITRIALFGTHCYAVAAGDICVFDVSDPTDPILMNRVSYRDDISQIHLSDGLLLAKGQNNTFDSFIVLTLSNPLDPTLISALTFEKGIRSIGAEGRYAFLTHTSAGLMIYDIDNPAVPTLIGSAGIPDQATEGIDIVWPHAYVCSPKQGLHIYDISDPVRPILNGWLEMTWNSRTVSVGEDWLCLGGSDEIRFGYLPETNLTSVEGASDAAPTSAPEFSTCPNPFNPNTRLTFTLPYRANVEISAYSISGRRVAEIECRDFDAGTHSLDWRAADRDGKALCSGVYFLRLHAGEWTSTRKIVLLR